MEWLLIVGGMVVPGFAKLDDCHKAGGVVYEQKVPKAERDAGPTCTTRTEEGLVRQVFVPPRASVNPTCSTVKVPGSGDCLLGEKRGGAAARPASCGAVIFEYRCVSRARVSGR